MCTGAEMLLMGGQVAGGIAAKGYGDAQNEMAKADALYSRDTASQEAQKIMRSAQREKGAARAATAASGARVDEFSMGIEREIDSLAGQDAAMAILSGDRRASTQEFSGKMSKLAGNNQLTGSLFSAGYTGMKGWKGAQERDKYKGFEGRNKAWVAGGSGWEGE